jgi:hypothetical protein
VDCIKIFWEILTAAFLALCQLPQNSNHFFIVCDFVGRIKPDLDQSISFPFLNKFLMPMPPSLDVSPNKVEDSPSPCPSFEKSKTIFPRCSFLPLIVQKMSQIINIPLAIFTLFSHWHKSVKIEPTTDIAITPLPKLVISYSSKMCQKSSTHNRSTDKDRNEKSYVSGQSI